MPIEFTDDDLKIVICPHCHGAKITIEVTQRGDGSFEEEVACEVCGGSGVKLTRNGAKLFDFVREAGRYH